MPFTTILLHSFCYTIAVITSNDQRLWSTFDSRLSLLSQVGDDVILPCKICGGMPDTRPKIHSFVDCDDTISTPICIRSGFFLHQTQLSLYSHLFKFMHHIQSLIWQLMMDDVSLKTCFAPNSVVSMVPKKNFKEPTRPKTENFAAAKQFGAQGPVVQSPIKLILG